MRWLAYLHPVFMLCVLALGVFVLRLGLAIRRGRIARHPVSSERHRRWARVVVVLLTLGFGAGLASMAWLRERPVFESFHVVLACGALLGLLGGGALGLRLERRDTPRLRGAHALTAATGLLLGLAAAVAGLSILP